MAYSVMDKTQKAEAIAIYRKARLTNENGRKYIPEYLQEYHKQHDNNYGVVWRHNGLWCVMCGSSKSEAIRIRDAHRQNGVAAIIALDGQDQEI